MIKDRVNVKVPKVACEILNYNDPYTVIKLVNKIKNYPIFNYILIVDNHSTDESYTILKKQYNSLDNIIVIRTDKNGGYGYGNDYGINYAVNELKANYVLLSNPDVFFTNEIITTLLHYMLTTGVAACAPHQKVKNVEIEASAWKVPTAYQWTLVETKLRNVIKKQYYYPKDYFNGEYSYVECIHGALLLLDGKKFIDAGGYDEDMFLYGEETTLGYRLKRAGYKSLLVNNLFYSHEGSVSIKKSFSNFIKQDEITHQSKLIFMKHCLKVNNYTLFVCKSIFNYLIVRKKIKQKLIGE